LKGPFSHEGHGAQLGNRSWCSNFPLGSSPCTAALPLPPSVGPSLNEEPAH
jgi:hypothetical protein